MAFLDMTRELTGVLPGLSPFLADKHINNAWIDACNARNWSWLKQDAAILCPAQVAAGSVAIVQNTATITCDATASAALLALNVAGVPSLTNMQIRFGATAPAVGQIYSIVAVNQAAPAAVVLTLDRVVAEATAAAASYQCYRCYVAPPVSGLTLLAWESVVDMANGWALRTNYSSSYFDASDPQRQSQGMAYCLGSYENVRVGNPITGATVPNPNYSAGTPLYELWPHPTSGQTFLARMKLKGARFTQPTQVLPTNIVEEQMIVQRALARYAYPYAQSMQARMPAWKNLNFPTMIRDANGTYSELLLMAKRQDDEQSLQSVFNRGHGLRSGSGFTRDFPIDSNFMQSHLIRL